MEKVVVFPLECKFLTKIISHIINFCTLGAEKSYGNHLKVIIGRYKSNTFCFTLTLTIKQ